MGADLDGHRSSQAVAADLELEQVGQRADPCFENRSAETAVSDAEGGPTGHGTD